MNSVKNILKPTDYEKLIDLNKKGFLYSFFTISIVMFIIAALVVFIGGGLKETYIFYLIIICLIVSVIYALSSPFLLKKTYINLVLKQQQLGVPIQHINNSIDFSRHQYCMFCSNIDLSIQENNILGEIYFNNSEIVFIPFELGFKEIKKSIKNFSPLSSCKFNLTDIYRPPYLSTNRHKIFYYNFPNNVIEISTPTESAYFYVPQAEETIKKLEAIKQELLSEANSENV
ncbi:MAG: hypothetical protein DWQ06_16160 [Calditrichaeota bacterium]|nr:MAG: hypothetical protein DWQ06_16160 [Calditrichota bacterium]